MDSQAQCTSGDDSCWSTYSLCSTKYSDGFSQYIATGAIAGTTTFYGYYFGSAIFSSSLISAASYSSLWTYTAEPPCCGPCSLNGGLVQVYVWPNTTSDNSSVTATGTFGENTPAAIAATKHQSLIYTTVSSGFTLYVPPTSPFLTIYKFLNCIPVLHLQSTLRSSHLLPPISAVLWGHPMQILL